MKSALNNEMERVLARPNDVALCPICQEEVISKCGMIKIWHWAHKSSIDCDSFGEPESEWHLNWKDKFPEENQEVKIKNHFADVQINGLVIELQNSALSAEKIIEREEFYKKMVWVLNGDKFGLGFDFRKKNVVTFRWKHPHKSWWKAKKRIFIDFGEYLFLIKKVYANIPCGGWGIFISKKEFLERCKNGNL